MNKAFAYHEKRAKSALQLSDMAASDHAVIILEGERVAYASPRAANLLASSPEALLEAPLDRILLAFSPSDARRIKRLVRSVAQGEGGVAQEGGLCLQLEERAPVWIDLVISRTLYQERPAAQMIWLERGLPLADEDELRQGIWRLQILHEIEHAILSSEGEAEAAEAALRHISHLLPDYQASAVYLLGGNAGSAELIAADGKLFQPGGLERQAASFIPELDGEILLFSQGVPQIIQDLARLETPTGAQRSLLAHGVRACLCVPLRWENQLKGGLSLYTAAPAGFSAERVQVMQEIANLLAVAFQQAQLKASERRRRREAEAMRDVMSALAAAGDLKQTLQAILVNLHTVIEYDHASLYLVEENERFVFSEREIQVQRSVGRAFHEQNPLIDAMRQSRQPLQIGDIQGDARFEGWLEVETVRGWLGAPLFVADEMIGFISLGSLTPNSFSQADAERLADFSDQVAQVIDRAWQAEQSQRRTEELDVLSSVTLALGQAEADENPLAAVLDQIARFSGARDGAFLSPDRLETALVVRASLDEGALGLSFPAQWGPLWEVYVNGETNVIEDFPQTLSSSQKKELKKIFRHARSALLVPVRAGANTFGVLGFGFAGKRQISAEDVRLCRAVADIAAASLRRSVLLESLEKQVEVRTQHLETLYDINAIASEPLALNDVLEQVLKITLETLHGHAGAIHFMNGRQQAFTLAVQSNLTPELAEELTALPAAQNFWRRLADSTSPIVINDTGSEANLPEAFARLYEKGHRAFIGAPIRAKGQALGLLSLFDRSILNYTIEDISLFMIISDQIGSLIERSRLVKQAEIAAVVQERQRLARELHDSVTQLLYSQVLFSSAGLNVLGQANLQALKDHLERINQAALQALKEMRLLVYQLRPADYLDEGLAGALRRRLDSVEKRTGMTAQLNVEGALSLDEAVEMALYRIAEEALNNILKHSEAARVTVTLRASANTVELEIADDGVGFDPAAAQKAGGMGLGNMIERAAALGGQIQILSEPGKGACIRVIIEVPV
ncbi:MAG: hypothetical protein B6D39_08820 [Anaerolineae bacterium UTCFX2]|nr:MAG: hypothetical protein B6D39_08820 [Anaerolineae bacterium UTCFX2]